MRKTILTMLLVFVSSNAIAEWVGIDVAHDGTYIVYADPDTILREGNKVKMWTLSDYKTVPELSDVSPFLSLKLQREFDCKKKRIRILYTAHHAENMGEGETVSSDTYPGDWEPVAPDSIGEALLKLACKKR